MSATRPHHHPSAVQAFTELAKQLAGPTFAIVIALVSVSCAGMGSGDGAAPYPKMEESFIPDRRPVGNPGSASLTQIAASLPIFEAGDSNRWMKTQPAAGTSGDQWLMRVDASKPPVRLKRLPSSPQGAARIKVMIGPDPKSEVTPAPIWTYELERTQGGWKQPF